MIVSQALSLYILDHRIRGNSPRTVKYYQTCVGYFAKFCEDADLSSVSLETLKRYYLSFSSRDVTSVTVQTYLRAVRGFLSWCHSEGYMPENLSERFKLPKARRKTVDILTDDELRSLMACFNLRTVLGLRDYCICSLMLDSGLRLGEVITLTSSSLHLESDYIVVLGKGDKERFVPVGLNTKKQLMRYCLISASGTSKTHLFAKDELTPLNYSTVRQLFRRLKRKSKIERLRPHLLRHTFATRYLENGGDIYSLQLILGHTSLEMVKKYVHSTPGKTAVNFSRFSPLDNLTKT